MLFEYILYPDIFTVQATETFHVDGIRYFSCNKASVDHFKNSHSVEQLNMYCNYVFPAIEDKLNKPNSLLNRMFYVDSLL